MTEQIEGVSVGVPTFRRATLLNECLLSVIKCQFRPLEIVISNDDPEDKDAIAVLNGLSLPDGVVLNYVDGPRKGQAANVSNCLRNAKFEHFILIHDDDFFLPNGIDHLVNGWAKAAGEIDAVYGFQNICSDSGGTDANASVNNNSAYFRCQEMLGRQESSLWAALVGQFPNNGFMVRRSIALRAGYPSEERVGRNPVDHHFAISYALLSKNGFILIPETVSGYRLSDISILRSKGHGWKPTEQDAHVGFAVLSRTPTKTPLEDEGLEIALSRIAPRALESSIYKGDFGQALKIWRRKTAGWPLKGRSIVKIAIYLFIGASERLYQRINS